MIVVFFFQNADICLVIEDYTASNDSELSVSRGQQVELLDVGPSGNNDWCLVRTSPLDGRQFEGAIPASLIKPLSNLRISSSRQSIENESK